MNINIQKSVLKDQIKNLAKSNNEIAVSVLIDVFPEINNNDIDEISTIMCENNISVKKILFDLNKDNNNLKYNSQTDNFIITPRSKPVKKVFSPLSRKRINIPKETIQTYIENNTNHLYISIKNDKLYLSSSRPRGVINNNYKYLKKNNNGSITLNTKNLTDRISYISFDRKTSNGMLFNIIK